MAYKIKKILNFILKYKRIKYFSLIILLTTITILFLLKLNIKNDYSLIGVIFSVKKWGIFVKLFETNNINIAFFPSLPQKRKIELDRKGKIYYIVKPGLKIIKVKVSIDSSKNRKGLTLVKIISNNLKEPLKEEDWVVDEYKIKYFIKNRLKYKNLITKVKNIPKIYQNPYEIFNKANKLLAKKKYLNAIKEYLIIINHFSELSELCAESQIKIAYIFGGVPWPIDKPEFHKGLNDPVNCREELLTFLSNYPSSELKETCYYLLAIMHLTYLPITNHYYHFSYMEKTGKLGKIYFSLGENILNTLKPNAILFVDPRYTYIFSLAYQVHYKKKRPDVSLYDVIGYFNPMEKGILEVYKLKPYSSFVKHLHFEGKSNKPVYYTFKHLPMIVKEGLEYKPVGMLYELVKKVKYL